jgi:preprotein translocase subunit YajC
MHGQKIFIANSMDLSKNVRKFTSLIEGNNMKKTFTIIVFALCAFSSSSFAEDTSASAPAIVAPAQPAAAQNINASTSAPATAQVAAAPQQSLMGMALPFVIMLAVMYFLMIRPQQKKMKEHQGMMSTLKDGDEVITSAGIIGTIQGMNDKVVTLEVSKNVQMKILKSQVNQVVKGSIQDLKA